MTKPVSPVGRLGAARRVGGGRRAGEAPRPQAAADPAPAAPHATGASASPDPVEAPLAVSAQILGQTGAAETDPPAKTAQKARAAYLDVEWSGGADRRNRRGRIAKTEI